MLLYQEQLMVELCKEINYASKNRILFIYRFSACHSCLGAVLCRPCDDRNCYVFLRDVEGDIMKKIRKLIVVIGVLFFCLPIIFYLIYIIAQAWVTMIKFVF